MGQVGFAGGVEALHSAVDQLLGSDLDRLPTEELPGLFAKLEAERRRLDAVDHDIIIALEERGLAGEYGRTSTADLLNELTRVAPAEAKARMHAARDLGPRRQVTGAPLEPIFPRTAAAQRAGSISGEHAKVIRTTVAAIPDKVSFELTGPVEEFLVEQAQHLDPKRLGAAAQRLLATIDPDGAAPTDEEQQRHRGFGMTQDRFGRWFVPRCQVTDEFAAAVKAATDPLSEPQPSVDGLPDDRTPSQRRHDAVLEIMRRVLRSGTLPDAGGVPTTINLGVRAEDLEDESGVATLDTGETIGMTAAMRLADQCELFTTVFDRNSAVLCLGRSQRCANRTQRRALAARDGGCCFPACTRPASWSEAHHVISWLAGGPTDIDNLVLLCGFHHREFERQGWLVRMVNGVPEWVPPRWVDPDQVPRRNTAHHLPEFDFSKAGGPGGPDARGP
jgi:hypothetical protein